MTLIYTRRSMTVIYTRRSNEARTSLTLGPLLLGATGLLVACGSGDPPGGGAAADGGAPPAQLDAAGDLPAAPDVHDGPDLPAEVGADLPDAPGPAKAWSRGFGGELREVATAVAIDAAGCVWVVGGFKDEVDVGGGPLQGSPITSCYGLNFVCTSAFVAKYGQEGEHIFSTAYVPQGDGLTDVMDVVVDSQGNAIVVGATATTDLGGGTLYTQEGSGRDGFLVKLGPNGEHRWSRLVGGPEADSVNAIALGPGDHLVLFGHFKKSIDLGGGTLTSSLPSDTFLAELDPDGGHVWSRALGWAPGVDNSIYDKYLAVGGTGRVTLLGSFVGTADFGGGAMSATDADVFATGVASDGSHAWSKHFGAYNQDFVRDAAKDALGRTILTGDSKGIDFGGGPLSSWLFLAMLNDDGEHVRSGVLSCEKGNLAYAQVAGTQDGGFALAGDIGMDAVCSLGGTPLTAHEGIFVATFDADGVYQWGRAFETPPPYPVTTVHDLAADPWGSVYLVGGLYNTVDFGGGPITGQGNSDGFVAKIVP